MSMKVNKATFNFDDPAGLEWRKQEEDKIIDALRNERMWELYKGYRQCITYAGKQKYILEHAIINKSKYFSMSKRRQKKFLDEAFGIYCDVNLDKLAPNYRRKQRGIVKILPVMKFVEQTGAPFNNFLNAWASSLLGGNNAG